MRFYEEVEKLATVKEPRGAICNCCGNAFEPKDENLLQQIILSFGYGSQFANNRPWDMDICENCWINFIKTFKYVPKNFKCEPQFFESAYDVDPELHQQIFENWKLTGEWYDDDIDNPWIKHYSENEFDFDETFDENDEFVEEFYNNQKMDDRKPLLQATLKIVK